MKPLIVHEGAEAKLWESVAFLVVRLLALSGVAVGLSAAEPRWIGALAPPPPGQETAFTRSFELPQAPRQALVRLDA